MNRAPGATRATEAQVLSTRLGAGWGTAGAAGRAVLLGLLLLPASWAALGDSGIGTGWLWALRITVVALHVVLLPPLVTRRPVVAFAVGSLAMLVLVAGPDLGGPAAAEAGDLFAPVLLPTSLVWFVLLYEVSARAPAPWPAGALGVGSVGGVVTVARLWSATAYAMPISGDWGWRLFVTAAVAGGTVAAWALGRYRATRVAWAGTLAERAAADERRRIAREMHDVVAHSLAVVVAQAEAGRMAATTRPERAPEVLGTIAATGREALDQMRGLLGVLRDDDAAPPPSTGAEPPRAGASSTPAAPPPAPRLADLPGLVEQVSSTGITVQLTEHGAPRHLGPAAELTAYRVVQESLTNVVRHAGPGAAARVELDWGDGLVVTVTDHGGARPVPAPSDGRGRGIEGMRERLNSVGGALVEAGPHGDGWRTRARIAP